MNRTTIFLIFLCVSPLPILCKRGGGGGGFSGGGGFNRGSSGARQQGPGSFQSGGNSFQGPQGGFNNRNGFNNGAFNSGGMRPAGGVNNNNFRNTNNGWNTGGVPNRGFSGTGSGLGSSSRASGFRNALLGAAVGAAGGILLYEGTKAIIRSATDPFHYNNRNYYWGDQYVRNNANQFTCSVPFDTLAKTAADSTPAPAPPMATDANGTTTTLAPADATNKFNNIQFQDGTRPKTVSWSCRTGAEVCCGMDCCPAPQTNSQTKSGISTAMTLVLGIILAIVLGICCCCCIAFLVCPHVFNRSNDHPPQDSSYQGPKYDDAPHGYPMQSYGNQGYPQQGYSQQPGYHPNQGYPQQYPPNPTY